MAVAAKPVESSPHTVTEPAGVQSGYLDVLVVEKGQKFAYTVPSFPVFTVMLREVKLRFGDNLDKDKGDTLDCYMRA